MQIFNEIYITLNKILDEYDNILLAGDLNIEELKPDWDSSNHLPDAKDAFNLTNLVNKPTCFKSQDGTLIDLMLTNRMRSFLKSQNFEIGLSDCHKLVVSILRAAFKKTSEKNYNLQESKTIWLGPFPLRFDQQITTREALKNCDEPHIKLSEFFNGILNHHAPLNWKQVRGNYALFMTKDLSKALTN